MSANETPIFTLTPVIGLQAISTANANRDGTGTIGTVLIGGAYGTRVSRITIEAIVTTTAGMIRLYIDTGVTVYLWREIVVTAITVAANVAAFTYVVELLGERALVLPPAYELQASTHNAETFNIIAEGAEY